MTGTVGALDITDVSSGGMTAVVQYELLKPKGKGRKVVPGPFLKMAPTSSAGAERLTGVKDHAIEKIRIGLPDKKACAWVAEQLTEDLKEIFTDLLFVCRDSTLQGSLEPLITEINSIIATAEVYSEPELSAKLEAAERDIKQGKDLIPAEGFLRWLKE
jgi:hypothetical protein